MTESIEKFNQGKHTLRMKKKAKTCGGKHGCQCKCGVCDIDECNCACHQLDTLHTRSIRYLLVKYDGRLLMDVQDMSRNELFLTMARSERSELLLQKGNELVEAKLNTDDTVDESVMFRTDPATDQAAMIHRLQKVIEKKTRDRNKSRKERVSEKSRTKASTTPRKSTTSKSKPRKSEAARKRALARCAT